MAKLPTTELEKSSLEAHVDLCAMRYAQLDDRLSNLETKVGSIHEDILEGQKSLTKVIITTAGTVIIGVLSIVVTLLMRGG
jgi:predicted nuclease with TOPRIM domain